MKNYSDVGDFKLHDENDVIKYNDYASKIDNNFLILAQRKKTRQKFQITILG